MNEDEIDANNLLDKWFASEAWNNICSDADQDDHDSIELMEQINEQLQSLIFHLNNKSGTRRVEYELKYFAKLCAEFDVPLF